MTLSRFTYTLILGPVLDPDYIQIFKNIYSLIAPPKRRVMHTLQALYIPRRGNSYFFILK